jgi:hypothetical protein
MSIEGPDGPENRRIKSASATRGIFEKVKGSRIYWIRYTDALGRLHREKVGASKALARKAYEKRKTEVREQRFFPDQIGRRDVALSTVIDDFLARIKGQRRSFRDFLRNATTWKTAFNGRALRSITPSDIERQVARRQADGLAPASIKRELACPKKVYNVAIADGLVEANPVRRVRLLIENNARVRFLTDDEEARLYLTLSMNLPALDMITFALHTGLRQGEQFNLRWSSVCLQRSETDPL